MTRRTQRRDGILLLIVLSLLVLFVLIGVTFVVVASHYATTAKAISKHEQRGDDPTTELDGAMYLLLRGSKDPSHLTYRHNLLSDLYGRDGFVGMIQAARNEGDFIRLIFNAPDRLLDPSYDPTNPMLVNHPVLQLPLPHESVGYYNGCVLTMLDGDARGESMRIVRYAPTIVDANGTTEPGTIIVAPETMRGAIREGDRFLINGRAFNGTGDGLAANGELDEIEPMLSHPVALLPNLRQSELNQLSARLPHRTLITLGDSDETWDAVDYQNFFLARLPARIPNTGPTPDDPLIPSFHRPFLINYWVHAADPELPWDGRDPTNPAADPEVAAWRRMVIARPLPQDHPMFTGSNPNFAGFGAYLADPDMDGSFTYGNEPDYALMPMTTGPWDVDNDNDGITDSIWVDLGMPVKTAPDGRLYKPLFAILCVDLDGRLNVNAHGVREYAEALKIITDDGTAAGSLGAGTPLQVTRGQGYGPAEIRLDAALPPAMVNTLLAQRYGSPFDNLANPSPGFPGEDPRQGLDSLSFLKQWPMTNDFQRQFQTANGSAYQTPSDLRGVGGVYLDLAGQPRYVMMGAVGETLDDPYETNLVTPNASDNLFTANDLEHLLRFTDMDVSAFTGRLKSILLDPLPPVPLQDRLEQSRKFTTASFDIPATSFLPPMQEFRRLMLTDRRLRDENDTPLLGIHSTISDLVRARLIANGFRSDLQNNLRQRKIATEPQVQLMVPPEIRHGGRMDVNRWLSNARDDVGSGSVDEPGETGTQPEPMWVNSPFETRVTFASNDPHYHAGLSDEAKAVFSRQVYARHLYCLAMLLIDSRNGSATRQVGTDFHFESAHGLSPAESQRVTARRIAQWAINVVDFRDPDVAMTPFEFDLEPFDDDGWNVDDDFTTADGGDRALVWGSERPELLLTETVAFHDRRVRDTEHDANRELRFPPENAVTNPAPDVPADEDLDQFRIPEGSLFVELYCTRNRLQNTPVVPNSLYVQSPATGQIGLDLGRVVNGSPIWRVAIVHPARQQAPDGNAVILPTLFDSMTPPVDPFDPNDNGMLTDGLPQLIYDRFVIFSPTMPTVGPPGTYYYRRGGPQPRLQPGQYAVVGPRPITYLGWKRTPDEVSTQQIELGPNFVRHRLLAGGQRPVPANVRDVVGIVTAADVVGWNQPRPVGLNVSEPVPSLWDTTARTPTLRASANYYPEPEFGIDRSYYDEAGNALPDEPLDDKPLRNAQDFSRPLGGIGARATGTHPRFRVALLQRLADPTKPWNAVSNPYMTVDSQPIDLTVFNGEEKTDQDPPDWDRQNYGAFDPSDDPGPNGPYPNPDEHFQSRERGLAIAAPSSNIWNPVSTVPDKTVPNVAVQDVWQHDLVHSLGYLNVTYRGAADPRGSPPQYVGDPPTKPFPWFVWNNRPFVSHLELMQVPSAPAWRMLYEFRGGAVAGSDPFDDSFAPHFSHLLNFFHSSHAAGQHANLCRLFDYLEVSSRFVGTEKWLNPHVSDMKRLLPDVNQFAAPFNRVSLFRDPGKININTIPHESVWQAIDPPPTTSTPWVAVQRSLMGESSRSQRPAFYANPVRSTASSDLMPLRRLERDPVNAGLLRSRSSSNDPLFDFQSITEYNRPDDNSYFKYHKLQRLGNLLTTHSNVYAVWITVGYFEVHPWNPVNPLDLNAVAVRDAAHPDGFQLGRELGSDTGNVRRHRAFYLIDRSVPVAYEPGENHNVDKAILLRRLIE